MASPPPGARMIGAPANHHVQRRGYLDLTRPYNTSTSVSTPPPAAPLLLSTRTTPILLAPSRTALVIVDMQNFFLSPALGRASSGPGHAALAQLHEHAIPAARKAGVRVVWLNWGLTDAGVRDMPPAILRAFGGVGCEMPIDGGEGEEDDEVLVQQAEALAQREREKGPTGVVKSKSIYHGLGTEMGRVTLPDIGESVDAGRMLMRDSWNAALHAPLDADYEAGRALSERPDVWIYKDRMSGMWGVRTMLQDFLEENGLSALLFAGVNTDQCVAGTLGDAFSKGYDCVLLGDGCGTTSPAFAQNAVEYNAMKTWGFLSDCESLADAVQRAGYGVDINGIDS